jgi:hypothetical protein
MTEEEIEQWKREMEENEEWKKDMKENGKQIQGKGKQVEEHGVQTEERVEKGSASDAHVTGTESG